MRIDEEKCDGCLECVAYCLMGAIKETDEGNKVYIDEEECVECSNCLRVDVCEWGALWQPELQWPRILRAQFSDHYTPHPHPSTSVVGRSIADVKTNDVTERYPRGAIIIVAELGRPGIGTRMDDVEKVAQAILPLGVGFEKDNPTYDLFEDLTQGKLREDVRKEKALRVIMEFKTTEVKAPEVLKALDRVAREVDTVLSVDIASMLEPDGSLPAEKIAREAGFEVRPNGKSTVGLGRPRVC